MASPSHSEDFDTMDSDEEHYDDFQDDSMGENDMDDSASDAGSGSDSGFDQVTNKGKGRGRADNETSQYGVDYKVLSLDKLHKVQQTEVDHVAGILGIKQSEAVILLRYFGWNKEKLIEKFMESPELALAAAGIHEGGAQPRLKRVRGFTCDICYDDDGTKETLALSCDMRYCKDCYAQYLTAKIVDEGESRRIQCMGSKCNVIVDEKTIELLVKPDVLERYRTLLNRTYVDDDSHLRWCPAPNCEYAIHCTVPARALDVVIPTVVCACSTSFCFGCGEGDHRPCCCPIVKRWLKKCADDSETANWISANTKECTKCHSTIEKNGGCNHMTCKKCHWEFCWVCMGAWSEHGTSWYNCARFEDKPEKGADAQSLSRASLERYLHYYNRYANHEQSIKLEKELFARIERKMEQMQLTSDLSWIEVQFLSKAVDTLTKVRTTLKWTYAMAFYLAKNNRTEMFANLQNDLEQAVESLSELLERPIEESTVAELRALTTDKTVYVQKRAEVLLTETLKDYESDAWEWSDPINL